MKEAKEKFNFKAFGLAKRGTKGKRIFKNALANGMFVCHSLDVSVTHSFSQ